MKIKLIILTVVFVLSQSFAKSNSFDYYSDGIYDTYIQISKDIQSGLSERYMSEYEGKYLVVMEVTNSSVVDIIFYKTLGAKNSLRPESVVYEGNGKIYLVFDTFDRLPNADFLRRKLKDFGLDTEIFECKSKKSYKRNPIVIKKVINDLKFTVKNIPTKVITVQVESKKSKKTSSSTKTVDSFLMLREEFCEEGKIKGNVLFLRKNKYKEHDILSGFGIVDIQPDKVLLKGDDDKFYSIKSSFCKKESEIVKVKKKSSKTNTVNKKEVVNNKPKIHNKVIVEDDVDTDDDKEKEYPYQCDFRKILTAKDDKWKPIRISDTFYEKKNKVNVEIKEHNKKYVRVRSVGAPILFITKRTMNKACEKQ